MTLSEVAHDLGVSRSNAYVYAHRGELPGLVTLNGRFWVRRAPFEAWLAGQEPTFDVAPLHGRGLAR